MATPTPTGVLDLTLTPVARKHRLANDFFSIEFANRPIVNPQDTPTQDAGLIKSATAIDGRGTTADAFIYVPFPVDVPVDGRAGVKGGRDGMLQKLNAVVDKEAPASYAGIDGTRITAHSNVMGQSFAVEAWIGFDYDHRAMLGMFTLREAQTPAPAESEAFFATLHVVPPPAVEATGFHGIEIRRKTRTSYQLVGDGFNVPFSRRPNFTTFEVPWPSGPNKGASAVATDEHGAASLFITHIPDGLSYDTEKGLAGGRDGMLKAMKATLVKETKLKVGGHAARSITATLKLGDRPGEAKAIILHHARRRVVLGGIAVWAKGDKLAAAAATKYLAAIKLD